MPYQGKYNPESEDAYKISRSKIDSFLNCPRCFYLDRRLGIGQPSGPPFTLNSAVDGLLKREFDIHRAECKTHPLMKAFGIDAVPYACEHLDTWRENFKGVQYLHKKTNFYVYGAIDDLWIKPDGELMVVDYKATAKAGEVSLDADWQIAYKRQMEIYQWLLRKNGYKFSDTGYFVYCNGKKDNDVFDGKLEFDIKVIPYTGKANWIDKTLEEMKACLDSNEIPDYSEECEFCKYQQKLEGLKEAVS